MPEINNETKIGGKRKTKEMKGLKIGPKKEE